MAAGAPLDLAGRLVQGTCGWGSPHQHLSVYPASCRSAEDRLEIYSRHFGAVEVDSTCYAIPSAKVVERWVARVPRGFVFLFKAFGAFCATSVDVASLPRSTRALLGPADDGKSHVAYARMPEPARSDLWRAFHACLAPVARANKLACVVFQFHTSFAVSPSNRRKVEELRSRLDREIRMAVEFRDRAWIVGAVGDETVRWCASLDLALVASDELAHETAQPDRAQTGLPPGQKRTVMPTKLVASASWGAVARVHRRHGATERVLEPSEIAPWGARIAEILPELRRRQKPMYVMWGTDYRDAPLLNAAALSDAAPAAARLDWAAEQRARARTSRNGVAGLFANAVAKGGKAERTKAERPNGRDGRSHAPAGVVGLATGGLVSDDALGREREEDARGGSAREEARGSVPGGARREGRGPAPAAKRVKHSAIARMFAERVSSDGNHGKR